MSAEPVPTGITLHQKSRVLEVAFDDGKTFRLPYEFLRVYSPSAEVTGHGPGQEVLQVGKKNVEIRALEPDDPRCTIELEGGIDRPPLESTPESERLAEVAERLNVPRKRAYARALERSK